MDERNLLEDLATIKRIKKDLEETVVRIDGLAKEIIAEHGPDLDSYPPDVRLQAKILMYAVDGIDSRMLKMQFSEAIFSQVLNETSASDNIH